MAMKLAVGTLSAAIVALLFYSSFLTDPAGVLGPLRAAGTYVDRGVAPATHVQPWHYYLGLVSWSSSGGLRWTEAAVVILAVLGMAVAVWPGALRGRDGSNLEGVFWTRYIALYAVLATTAFSVIPYKTPWNLLPFYVGILVLAGVGFSTLYGRARAMRPGLALLLIASAHLGWQAWRASVTYGADPRNPYVYAHTVPDAVRMANRIRDLSALHPEGARMQVSVIAPPHEQWPLPWYLRAMPNVGYWAEPGDTAAETAPVIVSAAANSERLDAVLGERYVSEFFGLRPEVLLALYIDADLWNRFLARAATDGATP